MEMVCGGILLLEGRLQVCPLVATVEEAATIAMVLMSTCFSYARDCAGNRFAGGLTPKIIAESFRHDCWSEKSTLPRSSWPKGEKTERIIKDSVGPEALYHRYAGEVSLDTYTPLKEITVTFKKIINTTASAFNGCCYVTSHYAA